VLPVASYRLVPVLLWNSGLHCQRVSVQHSEVRGRNTNHHFM